MFQSRWQLPRTTVAVGALLALSACADQPVGPAASPEGAPLFSTSSSDDKPEFVPNTTRYQNTSKPNATGRAGSATVVARALLGKDGKTLVEATTGGLDGGAAAAGNLDKVQVKGIVDPEQDPIFTRNFNKLKDGGYFAQEFEGLARGATAQVQVNVSGIDRNRTGVVTLPEMVKMRPDLQAEINSPSQAYINADVLINGVVSEINGDVGATADCVLYVDGTEKDRAGGIWVNSGSQVSCAFRTKFAAVGTYEVTVAAEGVVPGDWDTANNAASAEIEIIEPTRPLHGFGRAYDEHFDNQWAWIYARDGTYDRAWRAIGRRQGYWARGSLPADVNFPVDAQMEEVNGGTVVNSAAFSGINLQQNWWYYSCSLTQGANAQYLWLCRLNNSSYGWYAFWRNAGFVTYYSSNYAEWTGTSLNVYSWNYSFTNQTGGPFANWASNDLRPTLKLTDADNESFKAAPVFALQPYNRSSTGARSYTWGTYAWDHTVSGRRAWASF